MEKKKSQFPASKSTTRTMETPNNRKYPQLVGSQPHHKLRDLANQYGPLMYLQLGEVATLVVSSPETAKEIMKTHDIYFAQRPSFPAVRIITYDLPDIIFGEYGEYWRQLRKICTLELLSAKRVRSFGSIREQEAVNLIHAISSCEGPSVNLSKMLSSSECSITARIAFGKKCKDQEAFLHELDKISKLTGGFSIADVFPSAKWLHVLTGTLFKLERLLQNVDG